MSPEESSEVFLTQDPRQLLKTNPSLHLRWNLFASHAIWTNGDSRFKIIQPSRMHFLQRPLHFPLNPWEILRMNLESKRTIQRPHQTRLRAQLESAPPALSSGVLAWPTKTLKSWTMKNLLKFTSCFTLRKSYKNYNLSHYITSKHDVTS